MSSGGSFYLSDLNDVKIEIYLLSMNINKIQQKKDLFFSSLNQMKNFLSHKSQIKIENN